MNGFAARAVSTVCALSGIAALGCYTWGDVVDPCYPQRYEFAARQEVKQAFSPQVQNGHILDQTVWNYHFEPGTATLTPAGLEHLAYLARRRPCPDPTIYLQVAQDIPYDRRSSRSSSRLGTYWTPNAPGCPGFPDRRNHGS